MIKEFFSKPMGWIALGAGLAALGSVIVFIATYYQNKSSSLKSTQILSGVTKANTKADSLQAQLTEASTNLTNANTRLLEANEKIMSLNTQLNNDITGGDAKPVLIITHRSNYRLPQTGVPYYVLEFDIKNPDDYALQNVRATVGDTFGLYTLRAGVKHFRGEVVRGAVTPTKEEIENYQFERQFNNIGRIDKNGTYPLYTTTVSPQLTGFDIVSYQVALKWYNGTFMYYINLDTSNDKLTPKLVQLLYNGNVIDYHKYFIFK